MSDIRIGFIGAGNMASAIIKGAVEKKVVASNHVIVYDIDGKKVSALQTSHGIHGVNSVSALCEMSDMLLMAVKPNILPNVLKSLSEVDLPLISIAAGWSAEQIKEIYGSHKRILRVMPNTPLMVGEGMSVFETPDSLNEHELAFAKKLFSALGKVSFAQAKQMDAVTAVSGSGPAYVFMFIEALADGGVLCGLPRTEALSLAAQTVLGSAKMVLDSGVHPGALKDAVCSPGGTTIEAVQTLEQRGFRGAVIDAVEACAKKSGAMAKQMKQVTIYTDGACSKNPGPGGWAAVLQYKGAQKEIGGFEPDTTNNRMELMAAVKALEALKEPCEVVLHTDSAYIHNAFSQHWIDRWQRNGWRTASKNPVENMDLWKELLSAAQPHRVTWKKVKGHSDNELNNLCDKLARKQISDHTKAVMEGDGVKTG